MDLKINDVVYQLTAHAKQRMSKRGVSVTDLVEALENIKQRRKQERKGFEPRELLIGRNKVNIVITTSNIVTVYNNKKEYYATRSKNQFNKKRRQIKKRVGNRLRRT